MTQPAGVKYSYLPLYLAHRVMYPYHTLLGGRPPL